MSLAIYHNINRKNLLQLEYLRLIAIFGQVATILIVHYGMHIALPLQAMFWVLLGLVVVSGVSFYRYQSQTNISDKSLFIELLFDVAALTAQLYFSGGVSNPFISLFLLQVIIAAILLRALYAWLIAAITIVCYLWLSVNCVHLHAFHQHGGGGDSFNLHLQGMLISYIFAAILLVIFVTNIIQNRKEGERKISLLEQQSIKKEQVLRMGLLATGAAHELSTPLSTIAVIVGDWKNMQLTQDVMEDVQVVEKQIGQCKKILSDILSSSGKMRVEQAGMAPVKKVFDELVADWKNLRNPHYLEYAFEGASDVKIMLDDVLYQAFFNIFDNALEASCDFIAVKAVIQAGVLTVEVEDKGNGFDDEIIRAIGEPHVTGKNSSGLGLFLAINALQRVGGSLEVKNLPQKGARVTITILLKQL